MHSVGESYRGQQSVEIERRIDPHARNDAKFVALFAACALAVRWFPPRTAVQSSALEHDALVCILALAVLAQLVFIICQPQWVIRFDPSSRVLDVRTQSLWSRSLSRAVIPYGATLIRECDGEHVYLRLADEDESKQRRVTAAMPVHCFAALADFVRTSEPESNQRGEPISLLRSLWCAARPWAVRLVLCCWFAWCGVTLSAFVRHFS